jgi:dTDP-glucose pyrophosphorylase
VSVTWQNIIVKPDDTIEKVLQLFNKEPAKIVLVTEGKNKLVGVVTDGDIRRGLLAGLKLSNLISEVMNTNPVTYDGHSDFSKLAIKMRKDNLLAIPIVENGILVGLKTTYDIFNQIAVPEKKENLILILAGGYGTRLGALTTNTPKPMLKVRNKPILDVIIESFAKQGFYRFCIGTHFKGEIIKNYFGDGSKRNLEIDYLDEDEPLGTGGALGLLSKDHLRELPMVIINGDILTNLDMHSLLNYHNEVKATATMCVKQYSYQIPYGVVEADGDNFKVLIEKPSTYYSVNSGIYVASPEVLDNVPTNIKITMPEIFDILVSKKVEVKIFPIHEYWLDIGRPDEFERAQTEIDWAY